MFCENVAVVKCGASMLKCSRGRAASSLLAMGWRCEEFNAVTRPIGRAMCPKGWGTALREGVLQEPVDIRSGRGFCRYGTGLNAHLPDYRNRIVVDWAAMPRAYMP